MGKKHFRRSSRFSGKAFAGRLRGKCVCLTILSSAEEETLRQMTEGRLVRRDGAAFLRLKGLCIYTSSKPKGLSA